MKKRKKKEKKLTKGLITKDIKKYLLVSQREMGLCNRMVRIIVKNLDGIHRWDLIDEAKISIRDYTQIKSYMEHKFDGVVKYEKFTEMWTPLRVPVEKMPKQETIHEDDNHGNS